MSLLYKNIRYLAKLKDIKMAELEKPHEAGYISRHERNNTLNTLSLGCVYSISKRLGYSVNELMERDIESEYELVKVREEIDRLKVRERELLGGIVDGSSG